MDKSNKRGTEKDGQVFVWQGYTGKVELVSFRTFLSRPVRRVALGTDHSLFLTHDDALFSCGSNEHGQLGVPNLDREYSFDPCLIESISGKGISSIACGTSHSAAIVRDGSLFCWGGNQAGQCGTNPDNSSIHCPAQVELLVLEERCPHGLISPEIRDTACQVSCGATHTMALSGSGRLWIWGQGLQLGLPDQDKTWTPVILKSFLDKKILRIASGDLHNVVIVEEQPRVRKKSGDINKVKNGKEKDKKVINACEKCVMEIKKGSTDNLNISEEHFEKDKEMPKIEVKEPTEEKGSVDQGKSSDIKDEIGDKDDNVFIEDKVSTVEVCDTETNNRNQESGDSVLSLMTEKEADDGADQSGTGIAETVNISEINPDMKNTSDNDKLEQTLPEVDVELRKKPDEPKQPMEKSQDSISFKSDVSRSSISSGKLRSKSFLDDTGAREFLARQFQDDDIETSSSPGTRLSTSKEELKRKSLEQEAPSSPGAYMMQTVTNLTSQMTSMTSHVTSMTTKALSNIVPAKLKTTTWTSEDESKSSLETLTVSEFSDLETGSTENINFENSTLDISNLTVGDVSANTSTLSIPESDLSTDMDVSSSPASVKKTEKSESPKSVCKEPQSIRTIEAKQENLRKRSLSLNTFEDAGKPGTKLHYSLDTEVWVWGKNKAGQLGLGDMLDRSEPYCIQILSGKRICKVACGSLHTLALTSTGEVYSWGLNKNGQLGHDEVSASAPGKIELTYDCCVWDLDAGSNHSIFLMDNAGTAGSKPEVFYTGKHPCKDLYVPIYQSPRLTPLKFVRKAGWINCVRTGGDNCACVAKEGSEMTLMVFELNRYLRSLYVRMHNVIQVYIKRLQISGFFTSMEVVPYKPMMGSIMTCFIQLTKKLGIGYEEMTDMIREGNSILSASIFTQYDVYITEFKNYSKAYEDMVAVGGFEYCTKCGSSTFENLQDLYLELLQTKPEDKPNHAVKFRQIMSIPLNAIKDLSQIIYRFSELLDKSTAENNLLSSVHLNLEHLIRTTSSAITEAENTRAFWELASSKISDNLKTPSRRLMKASRNGALTLTNAGRFSSHNFYLFNDIFIHSMYSTYMSYPLELVWVDSPNTESATQQFYLNVVTPEDTINLSTTTSQVKVEWLVAFNSAINKVLSSQKSYSRQNSGERIHTPVIRYAQHTFTKHALYKDATYKGYWLNGKVHGSGILKWADGKRYRGKFKHGAQTGFGKLVIQKDGEEEILEGVWKDGKLHGHGKIKYSNGDMYDGHFKDGLRHGHGVYRKGRYLNSASFVYVGDWLYDKKHGYGVMDDILKGEKYMGMWQEDNRHGDGVVVTLDGMYFEGNFQANKLVVNQLL